MEFLKKHFIFKGTSLRAELTRHAGGTFLFNIFGLFFQIVSGITLARILGAEGYGIYSYPLAIVGLLNIPATMGLPNLIVRNISQYHANQQFGLLKGLLRRSHQFVLSLSILFAGIAFLLFLAFTNALPSAPERTVFILALLTLPFTALKQVRMATLRGLRKVLLGQIPDSIVRPLLFLSLVFLSVFLSRRTVTPPFIMFLQLCATAGAFAFGAFLLLRHLPIETQMAPPLYDNITWLKSAFPFMFLGLVQIINQNTDIVMIGMLRPIAEVGIYKTVVQGSTLVTFILSAVNMAQGPQIARLWALGEHKRLQRMITISTRIIAVATLIVAGFLFFCGRFFLVFFFGTEFGEGATALRILCAGQIINGLAGSVGGIMNMTGFERKAAQALAIACIVNIILNISLIPRLGIEGAATATAISLSTWNIILIYWVKKYTNITSYFRIK